MSLKEAAKNLLEQVLGTTLQSLSFDMYSDSDEDRAELLKVVKTMLTKTVGAEKAEELIATLTVEHPELHESDK